MAKKVFGVVLFLGLVGCQTSFTGSPHVENGRAGCEAKCRGQGMDVAGLVYMGEYSSACVCSVPGQGAKGRGMMVATAAGGAGAVGVVMQMRQNEENRNH
jgi:hypothetical protein